MDEMLKDFVVEALELGNAVEQDLLILERDPENKDVLNAVFRSFHTIKGGAGFMGLGAMVAACHHTENLFDALRVGSAPVTHEEIDLALRANSFIISQLNDIASGVSAESLSTFSTTLEEELSHAVNRVSKAAISIPADSVASESPPLNWELYYRALVPTSDLQVSHLRLPADHVINELKPTEIPAKISDVVIGHRERRNNAPLKEDSIRIDASKLDALLEVAGESVQAANQAFSLVERLSSIKMVDQAASALVKALVETLGRAIRYSADLQKATLATRMQPVGKLFQKFPRLVRDLAKELGKDVDLIIEGSETEVDRVVVESLYDPLVHMLRNALDHGIESLDERLASGKPLKAVISLRARQEANSVMIELTDDGKGMDAKQLHRKAVAKGLINDSALLNDTEAFQLVFLPGFSTKDVSTSVSGRGVGMDVVKTAVEKNRGTIKITSALGVGTTFVVRLPIELSIVPTMLVTCSGAALGVPMSLVERVIELPHVIRTVGGAPVVMDQGRALPVRSLAQSLGYSRVTESSGIVVLANPPYILSVGSVDGVADLVIKPLTALEVRGIAGTARSADGELVLVVDPSFVFSGANSTDQNVVFDNSATEK